MEYVKFVFGKGGMVCRTVGMVVGNGGMSVQMCVFVF